jgi:hypothetical protein
VKCIMYISTTKIQYPIYYKREFSLDRIGSQCQRHFRFKLPELETLCEKLQLPLEITTPSRDRASGLEAMCIVQMDPHL